MNPSTVTVVVITRNRPAMLRDCLDHLRASTRPPDQLIVVDASSDEATRHLVGGYPEVTYLFLPRGNNRMPGSRNLALRHATGEVVAFLDDDSMARPDWLSALMSAYDSPDVGGVGGRAIDPQEPTLPDPTKVGRILPDGSRIDNFNADPGSVLDVDRVRGCNMSFRRALLLQLGGFDEGYTGSNVNEASDVCLRVRHAGYRIRYHPGAAVNHLSAPREAIPRGRQAAVSEFYHARNKTYLLLKNYGPRPGFLRALYASDVTEALREAITSWAWLRAGAHVAGKALGTLAALGPRRIDRGLRRLAKKSESP